jgi:hypothetical protein
VLFLLWGAFFGEHALAWFRDPAAMPPARVWLLQLCHLGLLIGYVIGWRWELTGGIVTQVTAVIFFAATAGPRAVSFIAVSAAPAVIWIVLGLKKTKDSLAA